MNKFDKQPQKCLVLWVHFQFSKFARFFLLYIVQKTRNIYNIKIDINFESVSATSEAVTGSLLFVNLYIE